MEKVCEVYLDRDVQIKAIDFYTSFCTIVLTTATDVIKIGPNLKPTKASETGVQLPQQMLREVCVSTVFEIGQSEYRACGLTNGEVSLMDGDDLKDWGEQLVKTFLPMTSTKLSKSLLTDSTSADDLLPKKQQVTKGCSPVTTGCVKSVRYLRQTQQLAFGARNGFWSVV